MGPPSFILEKHPLASNHEENKRLAKGFSSPSTKREGIGFHLPRFKTLVDRLSFPLLEPKRVGPKLNVLQSLIHFVVPTLDILSEERNGPRVPEIDIFAVFI